MSNKLWLALMALGACSSASTSQPQQRVVPAGAKIEPSGFATIATAPASPFPDQLPPPEKRPKDERGYYAQLADISDAEAAKRLREQCASRPAFEQLLTTLRRRSRQFHRRAADPQTRLGLCALLQARPAADAGQIYQAAAFQGGPGPL